MITHLHPDHCVDLLALRVYLAYGPGRGRPLRVLGPPGLRERLVGFGGSERWDDVMRFEELTGVAGERDLGGGVTLRYRQVPHLPPTFALRVEAGGPRSASARIAPTTTSCRSWPRSADVLVCECSFGAGEVPTGRAAPERRPGRGDRGAGRARRLLLTHCFPRARPRRRPRGGASRVRRAGGVGRPGRRRSRREPAPPAAPGRRALIIAVVLSLLLPGLGHAYMGRLGRALIWFGGTIVIALVIGQGSDNTALALSMGPRHRGLRGARRVHPDARPDALAGGRSEVAGATTHRLAE